MRSFENLSITWKLTLISMLTSGIALMITCGVMVAYELANFRLTLVDRTLMTAAMIGDNSASALTFGDPESAAQTLRSLGADEQVSAAIIYDAAGNPFARYQPAGGKPFSPPTVARNSHRFTGESLEAFRDISVAGEVIGSAYLRYDMIAQKKNLWRLAWLAGIVTAGASLVALLLTGKLMPLVSGPILDLQQIVRGVAETKDFTVRAVKRSDDEVGRLIDGFNEMLGEIQQRDAALQAARNEMDRHVEEKLRSSEELSRSIIASAHDAFIGTDVDGRIWEWNRQAEAVFGWTRQQAMGRKLHETIIPVAHRAAYQRVNRHFQATGEGPGLDRSMELTALRRNGEEFPLEMNIWALQLGTRTTYSSFMRDVTERKKAQAELDHIQKQLLETSRRAGMAEVATSVLQDVGNVLNSVNISCSVVAERVRNSGVSSVGRTARLLHQNEGNLATFLTHDAAGQKLPQYLGMLAGRLADEQDEVLGELELLGKNIYHIKEIVAMQQNSAKVSGVAETLAVVDLIEDSLRMNDGSLAGHAVRVIREFAEVPPITVEKHKALQVLVNLIRNATQACESSGRAEQQVTLRVGRVGSRVQVAVSDNGMGIPPENLTRIFAHGFTTKVDGHGFGLHSGALAAAEMGGSLTVHSDGLGRGATFTLELPCGPPVPAHANLPGALIL